MQFLRTSPYLRDMKRIGATAAEMERIEAAIATNPAAGAVVPGLGGIRKLRFGFGGRGKRGGGRVVYALILRGEVVALLRADAKNEADDLTPDERRRVLALLKEIEGDGGS